MTEKYFLLIAGLYYYPQTGTEDWIGTYSSQEDAEKEIKTIEHTRTITKGKRKGEKELEYTRYQIKDSEYDWYEIIDLRDWIFQK